MNRPPLPMRALVVRALLPSLAFVCAVPADAADGDARRPGPSAEARSASPAALASADGRGGAATTLFRSIMPDGRLVIGDRPEPGARRVEAIGSAPAGDRPGVARAQQEREYWRQRAEAFAQRQRQRDRDLDAERERRERAAEPGPAAQAPTVIIAPPILFRPRQQLNYTGQQPASEYATTPGAAGRNLGAPGIGLANDAPGVGLTNNAPGVGLSGTPPGVGFSSGAPGVGAAGSGGFGPGAAGGAPSGFVGSGFGSSTR